MLVAAPIQHSQVGRESKQEAQLLNPQVCLPKMLRPFLGVGGLDQRFEHVEGGGLDAVADGELVALGEFLDRRHEPRQELVVRFDRRAGALGVVCHWRQSLKKIRPGLRPGPKT